MSPEEANRCVAMIIGSNDPIKIDKWWKTPIAYFDGQPPLVVWSTDNKWITGFLKPY